jgi:hypothetical protein
MKATILLGTLKKSGLSNTETLCEFLVERMERRDIRCEIVKLSDRDIPPGVLPGLRPNGVNLSQPGAPQTSREALWSAAASDVAFQSRTTTPKRY